MTIVGVERGFATLLAYKKNIRQTRKKGTHGSDKKMFLIETLMDKFWSLKLLQQIRNSEKKTVIKNSGEKHFLVLNKLNKKHRAFATCLHRKGENVNKLLI